ncbi:MAG TPA: DnaB-like helicase C-terminal domain-containing protein, partial [Pirellulales bacterium]|nr:DnaB-like helicase C-terminal domain-containing protein [Pirellulales bacterium]
DADVVMFVHRDEYYMNNDEDKARVAGDADIILSKQRNGPTGDIKLTWLQDFTRFEDRSHMRDEYDFSNAGSF